MGGVSPQPPLSSLPQTALAAAEKRAHSNSLLPSGPKLLGGDRFVMYDLSPVQAAAVAAEKRLQYDLRCASQTSEIGESSSDTSKDLVDMCQNIGHSKIICGPITNASDTISRKRNRESNISSESNSVDLEAGTSTSEPMLNHNARTHKSCKSSPPLQFLNLTVVQVLVLWSHPVLYLLHPCVILVQLIIQKNLQCGSVKLAIS